MKFLRWYDYILINIHWFSMTTRSNVLTPLVIPLLVQQFVGEETKGTYLGIIRLWALMAALLIQAITGILSDRTTWRMGRRRPFILIGSVIVIIVFTSIGFSSDLKGMTGYWVLFTLYIFSMLGGDMSIAAMQGLIPDLIPAGKKGVASGIKAIFEIPLPLAFIALAIAKMVAAGNLWGALLTVILVHIITTSITMFIREKPLRAPLPPFEWITLLRPIAMTGVFTIIILSIGRLVNGIIQITKGLQSDYAVPIIGITGVVSIAIISVLGVWAGIRISLGKEMVQNKSYTWWVVNRLTFLVAVTNLGSFMLFFLQEKFSDFTVESAAEPASKLIMYVGMFTLITSIISGWLADRFKKKNLIALGGILVALGSVFVIFAPIMQVTYTGGAIVGAGIGLFYSANWALGTKIVPKDKAGQYLGLSNLAGAGAGAIGAYIGGTIADNTSFTLLMSIYGFMSLLSIFALIGIKEPER